jgi:prolyl-tRNA editing enzyme YbaK/EbsC (Cys-tRNA(Pro) deacylase)
MLLLDDGVPLRAPDHRLDAFVLMTRHEQRGVAVRADTVLPDVDLRETTVDAAAALRMDGYASPVRATWPEPVERVAAYLREAGAEARIEELEAGTATAADAAKAAGCTLEQIVKSIVLFCDGKPVLALVPGDRRADVDKIARAAGAREGRIARAAEVEEATGFAPGAVAPFPLPNVERVLIDQSLLGHDVVWIGAGSTSHIAAMNPADLERLACARSMDAVQASTYHSPERSTDDARD